MKSRLHDDLHVAAKGLFCGRSCACVHYACLTPAFSVTWIGDIFVHLLTCHLSTCYLNSCLTVNRQFFILLAEEMTNK